MFGEDDEIDVDLLMKDMIKQAEKFVSHIEKQLKCTREEAADYVANLIIDEVR